MSRHTNKPSPPSRRDEPPLEHRRGDGAGATTGVLWSAPAPIPSRFAVGASAAATRQPMTSQHPAAPRSAQPHQYQPQHQQTPRQAVPVAAQPKTAGPAAPAPRLHQHHQQQQQLPRQAAPVAVQSPQPRQAVPAMAQARVVSPAPVVSRAPRPVSPLSQHSQLRQSLGSSDSDSDSDADSEPADRSPPSTTPSQANDDVAQPDADDLHQDDADDAADDADDDEEADGAAGVATGAPTPLALPLRAKFARPLSEEVGSYSDFHALWLEALPEAFGALQFQHALQMLTRVTSLEADSQFQAQAASEYEWNSLLRGMGLATVGEPPAVDPRLAPFGILVSCAKFLIAQQLRSQHGGALPTLTYLDKILTANFKARPMEDDASSRAPAAATPAGMFASRLPLRRTLLFLGAFEQLIHHSALGSAVLSPASSKSGDFFHANLAACTTFFERIRAKLLRASVNAEWPANTVHQAHIYLPTLVQTLAHVWIPAASGSTVTAPLPQAAPRSLNQADLIAHRQLLETAYDLSQAHLQLGDAAAIDGLQHRLRGLLLCGVTSGAVSVASLCFYLHAAELQSAACYELAIDEYKRVLGLSFSSGSNIGDESASGPSTLLPNSIALQACVHGLAACHLQLGDVLAMEADMVWCEQMAARWDALQPVVRSACPSLLHPLLPNAQTVADVMRWPVQPTYMQALKTIEQLTTRHTSAPLASDDLQRVRSIGDQLRDSLLRAFRVASGAEIAARGPFIAISAEQQAAMSDELMVLALTQRLTSSDLDANALAVGGLQLQGQVSAAQALTSWGQNLRLSASLAAHRTALTPPTGPFDPSSTSSYALDAFVRSRCGVALRAGAIKSTLLGEVLSREPLLGQLDARQFNCVRRVHGALALMAASSPSASSVPRPQASSTHELLLSFADLALRSNNMRLADRLLKQLTSAGDAATAPRVQLLSALSSLSSRDADTSLAGVRMLKQLASSHPNPVAQEGSISLSRFALQLSNEPILLASDSSSATEASYQAYCYLLEHAQLLDSNAFLGLEFGGVAIPSSTSSSDRVALLLHLALQANPTSAHLSFAHARLYMQRALQMCSVPVCHAHLFPDGPSEDVAISKHTGKKKHASRHVTVPANGPATGEEMNKREEDEDYSALAHLLQARSSLPSAMPTPELALLAAIVSATNSVLDGSDLTGTQSTASLTIPMPPLVEVPSSFGESLRALFIRVHPPLWNAVAKAMSHLLQDQDSYHTVLVLATRRLARVLKYAESAMQALVQAQQLQASDVPARPPVPHADIPLHLLTLLTRFGGEMPSALRPLLTLPPSTFLSALPQLFARAFHPRPLVRATVLALLARLGESYPHQLVFPLCVALHEEEEWRRETDRCTAALAGLSEDPSSQHAAHEITPKHALLLRLALAIDYRSVSLMMRDSSNSSLQDGVLGLFDGTGSLPSSSPSAPARTFFPLLSSVHRIIVELNRLAFLPEDLYLWDLRRIQTDLEVVVGAGAGTSGSRAKMLQDELEFVLHSGRQKNHDKSAGPKTTSTATLQQLHERYTAIMAPVMHQLQELQHATLLTGATPHELRFQRKYAAALNSLTTAIVQPSSAQLHKPLQLLLPQIHNKINTLRKSMAKLTNLRMKDVSPYLTRWMATNGHQPPAANKAPDSGPLVRAQSAENAAGAYAWYSHVSASHAPVVYLAGMQSSEDVFEHARPSPAGPGDSESDSSWSFVHAFHRSVEILRTKTRPKKLSLVGSDGRGHTVLLKIREDLHLDQRMMQVIQHTNRALYQQHRHCHGPQPHLRCIASQHEPASSAVHVCATRVTGAPLYARAFSVTPLSDRSGIIKWVDGVSAVFDLYKASEAQRKSAEERAKQNAAKALRAAALAKGGHLVLPTAEQAVVAPRSTDIFSSKLLHALQAAGLRSNTPRKDIPLHILVGVHEDMRRESGSRVTSILQRELWVASTTADEAHAKQRRFAHSLAVMSVLGYIIGLGDRHLGNIMVHLGRGDVLHIDYNICLERGAKLPIPEVVPFRLTPILQAACGVTVAGELERGNFYHAACATLSVMRASESALSSMLSHAFVSAPLAEWKSLTSKPLSLLRKNMDLRLSLTMLTTRLDGAMAISTSLTGAVSSAMERFVELQRLCASEGHTLAAVEDCMRELQQMQPLLQGLQRLDQGALDYAQQLASLHTTLHSFVQLQHEACAGSLATLRSTDLSVTSGLSVQAADHVRSLFASTEGILSRQASLVHTLAGTPYLMTLFLKLNSSRQLPAPQSHAEQDPRLQDVRTLVGPLQQDSRAFSTTYAHLGRCLESLPIAYHPRAPPGVSLANTLRNADATLGSLHARFKAGMQHVAAVLLFYRQAADVFVDDLAPPTPGSAPAGQRLLLHSATSTFVYHLLQTYLLAPPATDAKAAQSRIALLQSQVAQLATWRTQSYGSCSVSTPIHAWQTYSNFHQLLLLAHQQLAAKYSQLHKLLLQPMGAPTELGEDLNPATRNANVPRSLDLGLYPPSLASFVTQARTDHAALSARLVAARANLAQRFSAAASLNEVLRANGWMVGPGSSHGGGLLIVDDLAAHHAIDHTLNLVTVLQLWHFAANILPNLRSQSHASAASSQVDEAPPATNAQGKKGKGKTPKKTVAAIASPSPSTPALGPIQPLVATVNFFPVHTQVCLVVASLAATTSFFPAFLHGESGVSHLVPSNQTARVQQLYDPRVLEGTMVYAGQLEELVQRVRASSVREATSLLAAGRIFLPSLRQLIETLGAWSKRLNAILTHADKLLRDEEAEAREQAAAMSAAAQPPNYAQMMQRTMPKTPTPSSSLPNQRMHLARNMATLLTEYSELQTIAASATPTSSSLFVSLEQAFGTLELLHARHVRLLAPWTLSPNLSAHLQPQDPRPLSSQPSLCLPNSFVELDVVHARRFLQTKMQHILQMLTQVATAMEAGTSAPSDQERESLVAGMLAESHAFLDRHVEGTLLVYLQQHLCSKLRAYIMPHDASPMVAFATSMSSTTSTVIPTWMAQITRSSTNQVMAPAMAEITAAFAQQMHGHPVTETVSGLFEPLSAYTMQTAMLDSSFHVLQQEMQRLHAEIETASATLPAARWGLYRCAWECSTPLQVALRTGVASAHEHQRLQDDELAAEHVLQQHRQQVIDTCSTLASLHPALASPLHTIARIGREEPIAPEIALALAAGASVAASAGPVWRLGSGHGVNLRYHTLMRLQTAVDELASVEHELVDWSGRIFDELENDVMRSYHAWAAADRTVEAYCTRVIQEAQQRRAVLQGQTQKTAPQLAQFARDILQLERYRLDPPSAVGSSGPADDFLQTTASLLQALLHALQQEQSAQLQQRRRLGAMQEAENRQAEVEDDLRWLTQNSPSANGNPTKRNAQLVQLATHQLSRWSRRCVVLAPALLGLLDPLHRFVRDTRAAFHVVSKLTRHSDVGHELLRIKSDADLLHAVLSNFVQQQPVTSGGALPSLDQFQATLKSYQQIQAPLESSSDPSQLTSSLTHSNPLTSSNSFVASSAPLVDLARQTCEDLLRLPTMIAAALRTASTSPPVPLALEERNRHGVQAVRRIQQKLRGADLVGSTADADASPSQAQQGVAVPVSVPTQVQRLIQEAISIANLSRMYSGWAPWI